VLPRQVVTRWLCQATVGRIVLGPDAVPLDVGRRHRLFSPAQRRALLLRDAGCRFPGCERPPRYTDAHHLTAWTAGGTTDLANAILVCRYHHTRLHTPPEHGGWTVHIDHPHRGSHGPLTFTSPTGTTLTSTPRGP
jgi:hypothetical protein